MKILTIDIETSPNVAHVWGLWNQNVAINQIVKSGQVISFAAKWYGKKSVEFHSVHHDGREEMVKHAHRLLDEADAVIHFNGTAFDLPWLRSEFVKLGLNPPSDVREIDLLRTVRKQFRFPSNKLQYVSTALGLEGKVQHSGHELWVQCLAGSNKAWALMRRYNKQDVVLTEQLYDRLLPWIKNHPNQNLYVDEGDNLCPRCGEANALQKRGLARTNLGAFQRFQCQKCGGWSRGARRVSGIDQRNL